jgi:hypothetical protein
MTDPRVQRILAEVLFPLIGILFWKWTFDFILWFYAIDILLLAIVGVWRHKKYKSVPALILPWLELLIAMLLIVLFGKELWSSLGEFLAYEDMGFSQGYFLLPIIGLSEWMRWKLEHKTRVIILTTNAQHLLKIACFALLGVVMVVFHLGTEASYCFLVILTLVNLINKPLIIRK